ncbi:hypothetical protein C0989_001763 [Termitomyces sp. Mn162]|nr:hypothetical protein C0989_001763 [Termitomyces sp. Mn162]
MPKTNAPAPPYISSRFCAAPTLSTLPPHILLHIIYLTFPQSSLPGLHKFERQRKTLYWLSISLRLVDRTLYTACMHVLRSTHIPAYDGLVRVPYTSDPFPLLVPQVQIMSPSPYASVPVQNQNQPQPTSPLSTIQRETAVLDKFIALKVREDVWADDSTLHLERDEAYKDLFDHAQPCARLEDLVRVYGVQSGAVCVGNTPEENTETLLLDVEASVPSRPQQEPNTESKLRFSPSGSAYSIPAPASTRSLTHSTTPAVHASTVPTHQPSPVPTKPTFLSLFKSKSKSKSKSSSPSPSSPSSTHISTTRPPKPKPIPISKLTITLTPRSANLVLADRTSRRTIASTHRTRDEELESVARRLVHALREREAA